MITDPRAGALDPDLRVAALAALDLSRSAARDFALGFSWDVSAATFRDNILSANFRAKGLAV